MKKNLMLMVILSTACLLSGCGNSKKVVTADAGNTESIVAEEDKLNQGNGDDSQKQKDSNGDAVVLKLAHNLNIDHPMDQAAHLFADIVEEKTGGQIRVDVYSQVLGSEKELTESLPLGTVDMMIVVGGNFSYYYPEFNFTSLAYMFADRESAEKAYNGEAVSGLCDRLINDYGVRVLHPFFYYGARQVTANKPIMGVADMKGVKLRVPPMEPQQKSIEAMGAQAVSVEFTELYTALQTGVVDAQENPFNVIIDNNYDQVQKYLMLTNHIYAQAFFAMNEKKFQSLSADQQAIILEAAKAAGELNNELMIEQEEMGLQTLKDRGMEVVETDVAEFTEAVQGLHKEYDEKYDGIITKIKDSTK